MSECYLTAVKRTHRTEVKIKEKTREHHNYALAASPEDISKVCVFRSELIYSILKPVVVKLNGFCKSENVDRKSSRRT